jgi:hypothetical protein
VAIAALGIGCPLFFDVDGVDLDVPPDQGGDVPVAPEMGLDPDGGRNDAADASAGGEVGLCVDQPGTIEGSCSPVLQDCPASEFCDFQLIDTEPVTFNTTCRPPETDLQYTLAEGEACDTNPTDVTCQVGLKCRIDRCARICRLDDGTGCAPGQYCAEFSPDIPEYGICADGC